MSSSKSLLSWDHLLRCSAGFDCSSVSSRFSKTEQTFQFQNRASTAAAAGSGKVSHSRILSKKQRHCCGSVLDKDASPVD